MKDDRHPLRWQDYLKSWDQFINRFDIEKAFFDCLKQLSQFLKFICLRCGVVG